jgi:hypothetical protein
MPFPEKSAHFADMINLEDQVQRMSEEIISRFMVIDKHDSQAAKTNSSRPETSAKMNSSCSLPVCIETVGLKQCSRCKQALYCSTQHQKDDWKRHKTACFPSSCPKKQPEEPKDSKESNLSQLKQKLLSIAVPEEMDLVDALRTIMRPFTAGLCEWACTREPLGPPVWHEDSKTTMVFFGKERKTEYKDLQELLAVQSVRAAESTCLFPEPFDLNRRC